MTVKIQYETEREEKKANLMPGFEMGKGRKFRDILERSA